MRVSKGRRGREKLYTVRVQVIVSPEMYEELKKIAKEENRTISEIGRQMFAEYIRYVKAIKEGKKWERE